jgi:hypothetical protein
MQRIDDDPIDAAYENKRCNETIARSKHAFIGKKHRKSTRTCVSMLTRAVTRYTILYLPNDQISTLY